MNYPDATRRLTEYRSRITTLRAEMRDVQQAIVPEPVQDYVFETTSGRVTLSSLFGDKRDLFVIHNMGASCPYCTLWADGYNGVYAHLEDRASFVLSNGDDPEAQQRFARSRGWQFPIVSHRGTSFAGDMGYRSESGGLMPGVSVFRRKDGRIVRVSDTGFSPGDDFCSVWHFFDLVPEGPEAWRPRFSYA